MIKTRITTILFLFVFFISACHKDESPKPLPDAKYPTTYYTLSQEQWEQVNSEFQSINTNDSLYINGFGFLEGKILPGIAGVKN